MVQLTICGGGKTGDPREKNHKYQFSFHGGNLKKLLPKTSFLDSKILILSISFSSLDMFDSSMILFASRKTWRFGR